MIQCADDRFKKEAKDYQLRFTCESCAWFDCEADECSHAYPNEAHKGIFAEASARGPSDHASADRGVADCSVADRGVVERVVFCKEFELA